MKPAALGRHVGRAMVVFPGGIAGASLKHARGRDGPRSALVFPGGIAGASLKQGHGGEDGALAVEEFSPAESPGPH